MNARECARPPAYSSLWRLWQSLLRSACGAPLSRSVGLFRARIISWHNAATLAVLSGRFGLRPTTLTPYLAYTRARGFAVSARGFLGGFVISIRLALTGINFAAQRVAPAKTYPQTEPQAQPGGAFSQIARAAARQHVRQTGK